MTKCVGVVVFVVVYTTYPRCGLIFWLHERKNTQQPIIVKKEYATDMIIGLFQKSITFMVIFL